MIYFSELKGKNVITEDNIKVGKLEDIIFLVSDKPLITKLVIRDPQEEKLIIPIQYLIKLNQQATIKKDYITSVLEENELHLLKNLLDKQIIDLKGNKIVRVNDVALQDKGELYVAGVDVGILGILRWLRLEDILYKFLVRFNIKLTSQFLSWADIQPLELVHGEVKLRKKEEKLQKISPADLANYLEATNVTNARKFLKILDEKRAAAVIERLNLNYRTSLFRHYKPEKAAKLLLFIDPDDAVDILLTLPPKKRQQILDFSSIKKREELNHLIGLSTTQIGNLLTSEFITVYPETTVKEIIKIIKKETIDFSYLYNIYVTNKENQLIGVFNLHEMLLQDLDTPVYKFMIQNVVTIYLSTPGEIVVNKMIKHKLHTLPVIDQTKKLLGIVTIGDLTNLFVKKNL